MRCLVTGTAGFIGSHVAARLVQDGHQVVGVDCFTDYYDPATKRRNLDALLASSNFEFVEVDLVHERIEPVVEGVDVVLHQAGQPGVRRSWSREFSVYTDNNVLATQRLLEAVRHVPLRRFIFASSSSVYGNAVRYPTSEQDLPEPHSPYGVTKLASEHLCGLYAANWGVPIVSLRYFTVYGARQRPDMAIHRLIESALGESTFILFGDGSQVRDFTHVSDVVEANLAAIDADVPPGTVINIAGGTSIDVSSLIGLVGEVVGSGVPVQRQAAQSGDVLRTGGSVERAITLLDWEPRVSLRAGLEDQVAWHRLLAALPTS